MSTLEINASGNPLVEDAEAGEPKGLEEQITLCETIAIQSINSIARLSRQAECDPERIAHALDRIDFALGQAIRELHRE